jgi:proteasome lid subunit RPN8/RPN11
MNNVSTIKKIVIDKKAELLFRRRAQRRLPKEYVNLLYGYIERGTAYVCAFVEIEHKATTKSVEWDDGLQDEHDEYAKEMELEVLGSIHVHPCHTETILSDGDWRHHLEDPREKIMGVLAVYPKEFNGLSRNVCKVAYWPGVTPIPIEYKKKRKRNVQAA